MTDKEKMKEFLSSAATQRILMRIIAKGGKIVMDEEKVDVKAACHNYLTRNWDIQVFNFVKRNPLIFFPVMLDIWYYNDRKSHKT